ncbi:interferon-induced protein 44-like [Notolabrus celidotus]|uniref:interferon-induced protein 44-like n=1 Tax=Notolabrus celidotus TaxID=1203425 RepID=UPI00148FFA2C|nr:interferon-induced protein 44-like [Notolabrus celidotus]
MGGSESKPVPAPPPVKPWRTMNWGDKQSTLDYVKNYKPLSEGQQIRILLHGPEGSGKSSFINSVQSVLHGRMYIHALAAIHGSSFTKRYTTYKIQKGGSGVFYPFVFNDIMGLSPQGGLHVDDVKLALRGHVKEGYQFNPDSKLSENDPDYVKSPTDNDKVHVLVCVIPANTLSIMPHELLQKIKDIREEASDLGIPQVVILTKIDVAYPEIREDLQSVYKVTYLKKQMEKLSADVGIPLNCIFPEKNYHEEITLDNDVDSLILSILRNLINFGEDCINFHENHP